MDPKKKLKKFEEFTTTKNCETGYLQHRYRYIMEFPLGDRMFEVFVYSELPSHVSLRTTARNGWEIHTNHCQPIQIKFIDVLGDEENTRLFYHRLRDFFSDFNHYNRKINTTLSRLDPLGTVLDRWDLRGCFISAINHGDLEDNHIEITLHYDSFNHTNFY